MHYKLLLLLSWLLLLLLCNECNGRCKVSATFVAIISLALHSVCMHILDLWLKVRMMMMMMMLLLLRLTDWLPATLCSLLPTPKALAIITSTQFYFISWMQPQSQPHLPPLLPPFVYLVFVSFLHAHKIKCNNSKRCNNSVRYLSRFLFYFSLCLALPLCSFFVCLFNFSAILLAARALTLHLHFRVAARPLKICCSFVIVVAVLSS